MALSVGRRNSTVLISGTSTPSLNTSTVKMTFTDPPRRSCTAASRSADAVSPTTVTAAIPAALNTDVM